jgi:hypothetical protein
MPFYDTAATYDSGLFYDDPTTSHPRTRMAQIKLDFRHKTPDELVALFTEVIAAMTGNSNFPSPNPGLPALIAARDGLVAKIADAKAKENAWRVAVSARDTQEDATVLVFRAPLDRG